MVSLIAFVGSRGSSTLAAFIASFPVIFLLNILVMYQSGGVAASVTYAKGSLLFLPAFACYAGLTIWLLPHLGTPGALVPGLLAYLVPPVIRRRIRSSVSKASSASDKGVSADKHDVIQPAE